VFEDKQLCRRAFLISMLTENGRFLTGVLQNYGHIPMSKHFDFHIDLPYQQTFKDVLAFATFAEAEKTLLHLDYLYRNYLKVGDKKGVEYCIRIAAMGRSRAALISHNPRVSALRRKQKEEIAHWFQIWMETPELFHEWLSLRKATVEFKNLLEMEKSSE